MNKQVNRSHTSFNGPNGVKAQANAQQKAAAEKKIPPTSEQLARQDAAKKDPSLQASKNHGQPNKEAVKSFNETATGRAQKVLEPQEEPVQAKVKRRVNMRALNIMPREQEWMAKNTGTNTRPKIHGNKNENLHGQKTKPRRRNQAKAQTIAANECSGPRQHV